MPMPNLMSCSWGCDPFFKIFVSISWPKIGRQKKNLPKKNPLKTKNIWQFEIEVMSNPPPVDVFFDGSKIFDLQSGGKNKKKQTKTPEGSILSPKQTKVSVAYRRFLFAKMLSLPPLSFGGWEPQGSNPKTPGFFGPKTFTVSFTVFRVPRCNVFFSTFLPRCYIGPNKNTCIRYFAKVSLLNFFFAIHLKRRPWGPSPKWGLAHECYPRCRVAFPKDLRRWHSNDPWQEGKSAMKTMICSGSSVDMIMPFRGVINA